MWMLLVGYRLLPRRCATRRLQPGSTKHRRDGSPLLITSTTTYQNTSAPQLSLVAVRPEPAETEAAASATSTTTPITTPGAYQSAQVSIPSTSAWATRPGRLTPRRFMKTPRYSSRRRFFTSMCQTPHHLALARRLALADSCIIALRAPGDSWGPHASA